mmetsp:Transcript_3623/g.8621  ORF Transcript_3623/g.8621 Transcript_3623/m.8621 type:complete len:239 (-) Transcript_3623:2009-2725(-)
MLQVGFPVGREVVHRLVQGRRVIHSSPSRGFHRSLNERERLLFGAGQKQIVRRLQILRYRILGRFRSSFPRCFVIGCRVYCGCCESSIARHRIHEGFLQHPGSTVFFLLRCCIFFRSLLPLFAARRRWGRRPVWWRVRCRVVEQQALFVLLVHVVRRGRVLLLPAAPVPLSPGFSLGRHGGTDLRWFHCACQLLRLATVFARDRFLQQVSALLQLRPQCVTRGGRNLPVAAAVSISPR